MAIQPSAVGNENFVAENPLEKADFRLAGGLLGVTDTANKDIRKRCCSEMELLLALWRGTSFFGSCIFVPTLLVLWKPKFFLRAAEEGIIG